jgi:hypothetical protein
MNSNYREAVTLLPRNMVCFRYISVYTMRRVINDDDDDNDGDNNNNTADVHTGFWWENLREEDYLKDPSEVGRIILKWI